MYVSFVILPIETGKFSGSNFTDGIRLKGVKVVVFGEVLMYRCCHSELEPVDSITGLISAVLMASSKLGC